MNSSKQLRAIACIAFTGLIALVARDARASSVAADNASNYSSFSSSGNINGGTGFGAWTITTTSGNDGAYLNNGSLNISIGTKSWGFYANSGTSAVTAERPFTGALSTGQVFQVDWDETGTMSVGSGHAAPPGSASGLDQAGIELRSGSTARFRAYFVGGSNNLAIDDSVSRFVTSAGYPAPSRIIFKLITVDTYELTIMNPSTGAAVYQSGTRTLGGTAGGGIDRVDLYVNNNTGNDTAFNSLVINYDTPQITAGPSAATTTCQGTTTPAMTVAASSTDGSTTSYAWRKRGSLWGKTWTIGGANAGNNGFYIGDPNGANGQGSPAIGTSCWAVWAQNNNYDYAYRPLVSTLGVNQTVSIDLQHGSVQTGTSSTPPGDPDNNDAVGFSLADGSGNPYFAFRFVGGESNYTVYDSSSNTRNTGLPYSNGGENIKVTLTNAPSGSATNYICQITRYADGSTVVFGGTLHTGANGGIQRVYIFNNNAGNNGDCFFNNLTVAGADDTGANYTTSGANPWVTGSDGGQAPLSNTTSGNGGTYAGTATSSFTITSPGVGDSGSFDCALMSGQGYQTNSSVSILTVNATPNVYAMSGSTPVCSSAGSTIGLANSQTSVSYQLYTNSTFAVGSAVSGTGSAITFGSQIGPGTYTVVATTNTTGCTANMTGSVVINQNPTITTSSPLPSGTQNVAGYSQTLAASGGTSPYTWSKTSGALPTGITLSSGGVLSGTPTVPGTYTFTVQAQDSSSTSCTGSKSFTLVVACNVTIAISPTSLTPTVAALYGQQLTASNGQSPYTYAVSAGSLPTGFTLTSGGLFSGTAVSDTNVTFSVTATDANGCPGIQTYSVTPSCPTITLSPSSLPNGTVAASYGTQTVSASGANGSYTFAVTSGTLPVGLSLNASTGAITGTPTSDASQTFTITATDSSGCTGSRSYTVQPACPTITVSPNGANPTLLTGTAGTAYSQTFTAIGANGSYTWSKSTGTLPTGLSLSSGGVLSGTPTVAGTSTFTILTTDSSGCTGSQQYSLTISCPSITVSPAILPNLLLNATAFSTNITASGSAATPYTYSVTSGTLPTGVTLTSGVLSGTPTSASTYNFTITATDTNGCTGSTAYTVVVGTAASISTAPASTSVCSNSTASLSVTGAGTAALGYYWNNQLNTGWGSGSAWTRTQTGGGEFLGSSTGNENGGGTCASGFFVSGQLDINSGSGEALGMFGGSGGEAVTRTFPAISAFPTVISIDMDNGGIDTGQTNGFSLETPGGANVLQFYFIGGGSAYDYNDGAQHATAIGFIRTGLRVRVILTSSTNYTILVTPCSGSTNQYFGTYSGTIAQLKLFNNNQEGGVANDLFFNNIVIGGYIDSADNYVADGNWGGFNQGFAPVASATSSSYVTPALTFTTNYDAVVYNAYGVAVSSAAIVTVNTNPVITTASLLATGTTGVAYSQTLVSSGGTSPYTYALASGTLPTGITLSSAGVLSGTNNVAGTYSFTVTVTDSSTTHCTDGTGQAFTLVISCPTITVAPSTLPNVSIGVVYSNTVSASGGTGPYTYGITSGALPSGITLNTSSGLISGTYSGSSGSATFTVTATDANGCTGSKSYTVNEVVCPTIMLTPGAGALASGVINVSYSQSVTASGGVSPYTYVVNSGSLPAGLSLNGSTGAITGTPTTAGTSSFTILANDSNGCPATASYSITINCPTITLSPNGANPTVLTAGTLGTAYSQSITASGGIGTYTYSKTSGTLPTGLSLNLSTGVLSGTPTVANTYTFTITATDTKGCTGSQAYSLTTSCPTITVSLLSVNNSSLPFGVSNQIYSVTNNLFTASGSAATPYTFSSGTLPTGLTLSTAGKLSGTPTTTNTVNFSVTATDTNGCTGSASYTITNGWTVAVTTQPTSATVCSGSSASFTVAATGSAPLSYAWRKNGVGWGSGDAWTFVNAANCTTRGYYINADPTNCNEQSISPGIGNDSYYSGSVYGLFANGGDNAEVTRDFSNLQVGQSVIIDYQNPVDMATNVINGGPTVPLFALRDSGGTQRFEFYFNGGDNYYTINDANTLVNSSGIPYTFNGLHLVFTLTGANTYNLQVQDLASSKWYTYVNRTLGGTSGNAISQLRFFYRNTGGGGTACQDFFFNILSVGGYSDNAANYTVGGCGATSWTNGANVGQGPLTDTGSVSGSATPTLSLSGLGSADSNSIYSVIVYNPYGALKSSTATLTVNTGPTITTASLLATGTTGVAYSKTLASSGGTSPYTYTNTTGALPAGLSLSSSGVLSGTPTAAGTYTFTIEVTDGSSLHCTDGTGQSFSLTIICPTITVTPSTLQNVSIGAPYNQTVSATGGNAPYTYSVTSGSLPSGLSLNSSSGAITGTYSGSAGSASFTITATDEYGCTGSEAYTVTMAACAPVTITTSSLPNGTAGTAYNQTISASGGATPYTFTVTSGSLPNGLSLSSSGVLSGTPSLAGTYNFTVLATDNNGCTGSKSYSVIISCPTITVSGSLPSGTVGTSYGSHTLSGNNGTSPYTFAVTSGSLPGGLTLASGVVSGTPTTAGTYNFTITATDVYGCAGSQAYTVVVTCTGAALSPTSLPGGTVGTAYSETITFTGGTSPYTFSLASGTLPAGLSLSTAGVLSGTPTTAIGYSFTITGTDHNNCVASQTYSVSICGPAEITAQPTNMTLCSGSTASFTVAATGTAPLTYQWRQDNAGWGTNAWQFSTCSSTTCGDQYNGFYVGSSTNCGGISPGIDIDGASFGLYANSENCATAIRNVSNLQVGQSVAVDYQNPRDMTSSGNGSVAVFGLQDSSGTARFELYFRGGDTQYTINDNNALVNSSGIPYTKNGLQIVFTLTGTNTYNLQVEDLASSNLYTFASRTLRGTVGNAISQLRFYYYNSGTGGTACQDFFFNNIYVGAYSDNATDYTAGGCGSTTWTNGSNGGDAPLSDGNGISGSSTTNLQISGVVSGDAGNYDVIVANACGSEVSTQATLTVTTVAAAGSITGSATNCADQSGVTYSIASVSGATVYNWTVPSDATITAGSGTTNITVTFGSDSGNVTVTPANGACSGTAGSTAVTVISVGAAGSIAGPTTVCPDQSGATYSIASVSGATVYNWTVPSDATITAGSGTTNITVTFGNDSGNVTVTPANGACSGTASSTAVTVNASPTVTASSDAPFFGGAYQIVAGQTLNLSASTVGGATAYNWSRNPSGFSASGQTVSDQPSAGTYTYTVSVPTSCGTAVGSTPSITVLASTDGMIPDSWKTAHGYSASTPSSTVGANGFTLLQSYEAGLNPTNAASVLDMSSASVTTGGVMTVVWQSAQDGTTPTRLYDFYDLTAPYTNGGSWSRIDSNIAPAGATTSQSDDAAGISQRFYRVTIAGHTDDVATIGIAGVQMLTLQNGANYISMSTTQSTPTLLSVLGTNLPQGMFESTATTVDIWDQTSQAFLVNNARYWLDTGASGWKQHNTAAPSNNAQLDPTKGFIVTIPVGQGPQTLYVPGFVPTVAEAQTVQSNGYTVASSTYPQPITLTNSGLSNSVTGGISLNKSDNLLFFDPATQLFDIRVWYYTGNDTWLNADASVATQQLQPGEAFLIQRRNRSTNLMWTNPVPYQVPLQGP